MGLFIEKMIYVLPDKMCTTEEIVKEAGYGQDVADRIKQSGVYSVAMDNGTLLTTYINQALKKIKEEVPDIKNRVRHIVFVHSIPFLSPKNVDFARLCFMEDEDFQRVPYFALSGQPCAIFHMGLQVSKYLLMASEGNGDEGVLLIGADKGYCSDDRIFFNTIMGDSVLGAFITENGEGIRILSSCSNSHIVGYAGENTPEDITVEFRKLNPLYIRNVMEACAGQAGLTLKDVKYVVPHSCNMQLWDSVAEISRFPRERILDRYLHSTGHLNSNDSFIHYLRGIRDGFIKRGDICILVNPGFGGTRGCTLLQF